MNILLMRWKGFGNEDITEAFTRLGHTVTEFPFTDEKLHRDEETEKRMKEAMISCKADFVFSFNYFPIIARFCHDNDIPYFAWVYDSPSVLVYNFTLVYPTNRVLLFDYEEYSYFKSRGINTVYYMPLAANPTRLNGLFNDKAKESAYKKSSSYIRTDIAFIGSLYNEKHQFYERMNSISEKTRGYLEGIMEAQKHLYGVNIIQSLLTEEIMDDMYKDLPMKPDPEGVETRKYLYGEYVVNRKLTAIERMEYLTEIGKNHRFDLYTPNKDMVIPGAINHGPVDFLEMAPFVFRDARINLNISLRSIHHGIPLRAFEIMAAGGLLLTNYQAGFADCFADDEYVYYDSLPDLISKIDYLLSHEDQRKEIARKGHERVLNEHTYDHRIAEMLTLL